MTVRKKASATQSRQQRGKTVAEAIVALANSAALREWLIIAALFVTAWLVLGQFREMQKVYRPIAEQAKFTRESYTSVERAFVSDVRLELVPDSFENGKPETWKPRITAKNSGRTPTKGLRYVTLYIPPGGNPIVDPEPFLSDAPGSHLEPLWGGVPGTYAKLVIRRNNTIGPDATALLAVPNYVFKRPRPSSQGAKTFPLKGVISGAMSYDDQFSGSERHITKFCFEIFVASDAETFTQPCSFWNCSDEDCLADKKRAEALGLKSKRLNR